MPLNCAIVYDTNFPLYRLFLCFRKSTLKYIPASTVKSVPQAISDKGIAGIVIIAVVIGGSIAMALTAYCCVQMVRFLCWMDLICVETSQML